MTELKELFPEDWCHEFATAAKVYGEIQKGSSLSYLDKGYVELVDYMGDDMSIVEGARTSFRGSAVDYTRKQNAALIKYLVEHRHTSPLELPVVQFRVKVPLFVRAQHVRHRTQSCNWESHRYQEPTGEYYVPPLERFRYQDKWNKQGSSQRMPVEQAQELRERYKERCDSAWIEYCELTSKGLSRETARDCILPNFYCTGVFTMKLHNLFHYLKLRNDEHAQPEIRLMAHLMERFVKELFPITYKAWLTYDKQTVSLTPNDVNVLSEYLTPETHSPHAAGAYAQYLRDNFKRGGFGESKRRLRAFIKKITPRLIDNEYIQELLGD